ncbi:Uncharacterised protein [Weissella viridescens]|uniref:Uncharacterized protein n=1 Tax=Weissella viridescens TaxID=1629 RepID=A0A380NYG9_WEIVI|nr:Uncharacterised protein [Weissella viridescens]
MISPAVLSAVEIFAAIMILPTIIYFWDIISHVLFQKSLMPYT